MRRLFFYVSVVAVFVGALAVVSGQATVTAPSNDDSANAQVLLAAGALDPTFSRDGRVITKFGARGLAFLKGIAVQPDGKIVAAGGWRGRFALARQRRGGRLDVTFSGDGKLTTSFTRRRAEAAAVAVQTNGKIVAVGTDESHNGRFALARYGPNGRLDRSFGGGDGKVLREFSRRGFDRCNALAIQPDGKIVVAGSRAPGDVAGSFAFMRFNTDGSLDRTFGGTGKVAIKVADGAHDEAEGVAIQSDGKIVAGGSSSGISRMTFALVRVNADGTPDMSWGDNGKLTTSFGGLYEQAWSVAIAPDGKIVAAGSMATLNEVYRGAVARYNEADGALDATFSGDGLVRTRAGGYWDVAVQPDGRIVAAGVANIDDFGLVRYNVDGTLDTTFSGDGKVATRFEGAWAGAFAIAIQPDGKIAAGGPGSRGRFLLARYLSQ